MSSLVYDLTSAAVAVVLNVHEMNVVNVAVCVMRGENLTLIVAAAAAAVSASSIAAAVECTCCRLIESC